MRQARRYHHLRMLFGLIHLLRNSAFIALFLFVMKADSQSFLIVWGRRLFLPFIAISVISIFLRWLSEKYEAEDDHFHVYKGVFIRSKQTVPFSKIQNISRHTSIVHRILGVTSLTFETGMDGENSQIKFTVVTHEEADKLEGMLREGITGDIRGEVETEGRTIHFTPGRKDIIKAAITSLSFLVLISFGVSVYSKVSDIWDVEDEALSLFQSFLDSWPIWLAGLTVVILLSVLFGFLWTYLKFSKYEISSDQERIYIRKGLLEETSFTISKERVQAIEIRQNLMKRLTGVAAVTLSTVGDTEAGEEKDGANSLFPYIHVKHACKIAEEILPDYTISLTMVPLPREALWASLLKPSWIWMIASAALFYFKPELLGLEKTWIILSVIFLILVILGRVSAFFNASYLIHGEFIQFRTGILGTRLFISKRSKIIEAEVTATRWQKAFGLASIQIVNRGKPVRHAGIENIPIQTASSFYSWFKRRNDPNITG
jgi:putative membrane protein